MGEPVANGGDDAPAGAVEAGIDAEDDHAALFSDRVGALRIWRAKLASSDRFIPHPQAPPLKGGVNQLSQLFHHLVGPLVIAPPGLAVVVIVKRVDQLQQLSRIAFPDCDTRLRPPGELRAFRPTSAYHTSELQSLLRTT